VEPMGDGGPVASQIEKNEVATDDDAGPGLYEDIYDR